VVNVMRGGPSTGLPTALGQADVMQAKWGTHGDRPVITLTPSYLDEVYRETIRARGLKACSGGRNSTTRLPTLSTPGRGRPDCDRISGRGAGGIRRPYPSSRPADDRASLSTLRNTFHTRSSLLPQVRCTSPDADACTMPIVRGDLAARRDLL